MSALFPTIVIIIFNKITLLEKETHSVLGLPCFLNICGFTIRKRILF